MQRVETVQHPLYVLVENRSYVKLGKRITHLEKSTWLNCTLRTKGMEYVESYNVILCLWNDLGSVFEKAWAYWAPIEHRAYVLGAWSFWKSERVMESWFTCLLLVLQWKRIYNCLFSAFQGSILFKNMTM